MNAKILLTDEVLADARDNGISVKAQLEKTYEGVIADIRNKDERLNKLDGLELCMYSAGLSNKSKISAFYTTQNNEFLFPAIVETRMTDLVSKDNILGMIIASTQPIDGTTIKALTLDFNTEDNQKALKKRDVVEGSDLPLVKIGVGKSAISLFKRGVAVETTYEAVRHTPLDLFLQTLNGISAYSAHQQIEDAAATLISGDGNDNPAKVSVTADTVPTDDDIVDFALDFYDSTNGLVMDTILTGKSMYRALYKMAFPTDSAIGYRVGASFIFPQNAAKDITVIYEKSITDDAGKARLIGLNRANALIKYIESGSLINELARNIRNQTSLGTISETVGFGKLMATASRILKIK